MDSYKGSQIRESRLSKAILDGSENEAKVIIDPEIKEIIQRSQNEAQVAPRRSRASQNLTGKEHEPDDSTVMESQNEATALTQNALNKARESIKLAATKSSERTEKQVSMPSEDSTPDDEDQQSVTPSELSFFSKMKQGMHKLRDLGFREQKSTVSKKNEEKLRHKYPSSAQVFKETYEKFPSAKVSGSRLSVSYILPETQNEDDHIKTGSDKEEGFILSKTFDPTNKSYASRDRIVWQDKKYYVPDKGPEDWSKILNRQPVNLVEKPRSKSTSKSLLEPVEVSEESISEERETQESMLTSDASFVGIGDKIAPEKPAVESRLYERRSEMLPQLSSGDIVKEFFTDSEPTIPATRESVTIGQKGFVSNILAEILGPFKEEEKKDKKTRKERTLERQKAISQAETDLKTYFSDPSQPFSQRKKKKKIPLKEILKATRIDVSDMQMKQVLDEKELPATYDPKQKTGWFPGSLEDLNKDKGTKMKEKGFHVQYKDWVGSYVIGTDYWVKIEASAVEESKKVDFAIDRKQRPWYDLASSLFGDPSSRGTAKGTLNYTKTQLEAVRKTLPETQVGVMKEYGGIKKGKQPTPAIPEDWNEDLLAMFHEFIRGDELSSVKGRLSLINTDRWLEAVGLLDYKTLTVIQTGFCFKAAGGSRYRGLTFPEFKVFLEYISDTNKVPYPDVVNRLKLGYIGLGIEDDV